MAYSRGQPTANLAVVALDALGRFTVAAQGAAADVAVDLPHDPTYQPAPRPTSPANPGTATWDDTGWDTGWDDGWGDIGWAGPAPITNIAGIDLITHIGPVRADTPTPTGPPPPPTCTTCTPLTTNTANQPHHPWNTPTPAAYPVPNVATTGTPQPNNNCNDPDFQHWQLHNPNTTYTCLNTTPPTNTDTTATTPRRSTPGGVSAFDALAHSAPAFSRTGRKRP